MIELEEIRRAVQHGLEAITEPKRAVDVDLCADAIAPTGARPRIVEHEGAFHARARFGADGQHGAPRGLPGRQHRRQRADAGQLGQTGQLVLCSLHVAGQGDAAGQIALQDTVPHQ